ncbi:FAD binding domain-containing protein [candidate division KSB1 bacterium]
MRNFAYLKAGSITEAVSSLGSDWNNSAVMAGGTDLIGEMKEYLFSPEMVVDVREINDLQFIQDGGQSITIGAMTSLKAVASDRNVMEKLPALSAAAGAVASPQIRNIATIGGNICQRPRCWYYRDSEIPCLRKGGQRCYAIVGERKFHAILGGGPCYIVHPSDTAVALMAYDTRFTVQNGNGEREVPIADFFVLPEQNPNRENILEPGDILTKLTIPVPDSSTRSRFIKVQEREAWDFAVASTAVRLTLRGGRCSNARVILGAAAPIPWRSEQAENVLNGNSVTAEIAENAANAALTGRRTFPDNSYKIDLLTNIVRQTILDLV